MKTETTLGSLLGSRELLAGGANDQRAVTIRLGVPRADEEDSESWYCPYQILGLGSDSVVKMFGVDALQSLLLALMGVRSDLETRARKAGKTLEWLGHVGHGLELAPVPERGGGGGGS